MLRWTLAIAIVSTLGVAEHHALAADLGPVAPPPETDSLPELGTGWYLRADVGVGQQTQAQILSDIVTATSKHTWDAGGGFGYRFNEWFRTDLTFGESMTQSVSLQSPNNVTCAYTLSGLTYQGVLNGVTNPLLGYNWSPQVGTCTGKENASLDQQDLLLDGYIDLGTWYGITPYVGAGVGVARLVTTGSSNYYETANGSVYNANLTPTSGAYPLVWVDGTSGSPYPIVPQPKIPGTSTPVSFSQQNWGKTFNRNRYNLAWALMGGIAYNITDHAIVDVGYRFLDNGTYTTVSGLTATAGTKKTLTTQELRIGLRYEID